MEVLPPVVYRPFPTSNHNAHAVAKYADEVVYRPFPTSNHNFICLFIDLFVLYIVRFLHQTTTGTRCRAMRWSCISSVSYIKPQLFLCCQCRLEVVYRPFPTSNHNGASKRNDPTKVVYRPFPTSNHNMPPCLFYIFQLYIVRFLHQTTTYNN